MRRGAGVKARPYHSRATRQGLIQLLDILCSLYVRARDKRCVICGSTFELQCGHYWKRATHAVRWDTVNCNALCSRCNYRDNLNHDPYSFAMLRIHGPEKVEALRERKFSRKHFTDDELRALVQDFRAKLKGEG